jgi:carbonic anhydrase/acetyltransferase-like protein (isoleucine patch superfamily)
MIREFESHRPQIDPTAWVDEAALVIGQVSIGPESSVWPMSVLRGDVHRIDIGARTNVQDGSILHVTHDGPYAPGGLALSIGDDVTVGHKVILHACTIGNRVLIGMGAIIMDGARIASDSIIGAGALVTPGKALEGGYLWIGSPVRRARALTDPERQYLKYSAQHYVRLAGRHRGGEPAAAAETP